jgi:hypothetical protein
VPINIGKLRKPAFIELFKATGGVQYAVMAIGENPEQPPPWAVEACRAFYLQRLVEVDSPGGGRPPKYSLEDGVLLRDVATLIVEQGLTVTAAVRKVTQQESDGTDFRRLMRTWKRHLRTNQLTVVGTKPQKTNKWLEMARAQQREQYTQDCFEQALAEIEAGNFDVTVDPNEEAERLAMAERVTFQDSSNPKKKAWIAIAPTSRERYVLEIKRLLLARIKEEQDKTP